ncbi:MAG: UvrB/UvrC motif-containing protein [Candidatus Omnitrophota bacterium]
MLCNLCHKNQATVHLTEIVDNQMNELHLCDDCARKKSMQMEQQFGLSDLLAGLVDYGKQFGAPGAGGAEKEGVILQCSRCGLTYEDFRKIGRLGCGECYSAFARHLAPLLKRIHGASQHLGKTPSQFVETSAKMPKTKATEIATLKTQLQKAIEDEEFEEAARLRDAIKEAESTSNDKEPEKNNKDVKKRKKSSDS